jgi:hypothetical protein
MIFRISFIALCLVFIEVQSVVYSDFTSVLYQRDIKSEKHTLQAVPSGDCDAAKPCSNPEYYNCVNGQCYHKNVFPI